VALPGPKRGSTGGESARLNIGLKSAETPVISGLQALVFNILTGTKVPVKNRLSRHLKALVSLHQDGFYQNFQSGTTGGQPGTVWPQPQSKWHATALATRPHRSRRINSTKKLPLTGY